MVDTRWAEGSRPPLGGSRQPVDPAVGILRAENDRLAARVAVLEAIIAPLATIPREGMVSLVDDLRREADRECEAAAEVIERALTILK